MTRLINYQQRSINRKQESLYTQSVFIFNGGVLGGNSCFDKILSRVFFLCFFLFCFWQKIVGALVKTKLA